MTGRQFDSQYRGASSALLSDRLTKVSTFAFMPGTTASMPSIISHSITALVGMYVEIATTTIKTIEVQEVTFRIGLEAS